MADDELREASREQWAGVARSRAGRSEQPERGPAHVEARTLDAEEGRGGDERFRVVLCRFGFMLMLSEEQLSGVRDHALEHAAVHAQPDGSVRLPARVTLGRAVRPA